jgi:type IV pilus assembly protein PilW
MSMKRSARSLLQQRGLSLIELMIALLVGLLLLGGLIQIYLSSKQSYNAQEQLARMQEGGRFAMDLITRDLRRAGHWGGNRNLAVITGNPGPSAPAHNCAADNTWGRMIEWRVSGMNQDVAPGGYDCATDYMTGTDILAVRYATAEIIPDGDVVGDNLFLRSTMCHGRVMTGALEGDSGNAIPSDECSTLDHMLPVVRRLVSNAYYIGESGQTCGAAAIPALFRVRLANNGLPVTEQIATGVEQLQVRYLVNGAYQDAVTDAEWPFVQAVRVWLLMRGECPEPGLANAADYVVGDVTVNGSDGFRRQLYVSTVMLRNPMGGL